MSQPSKKTTPSPPRGNLSPPRLPNDEYKTLQDRHRISRHLETVKVPGSPIVKSPKPRDEHRTQAQRFVASQVRYATRQALGCSFDFTDESLQACRKSIPRSVGLHRANAIRDPERRARYKDSEKKQPYRARGSGSSSFPYPRRDDEGRRFRPLPKSPPHLDIPDNDERNSASYAKHMEVMNMMEQTEAYRSMIESGRGHMLRYREDTAGRPVRVMNQAIVPIPTHSAFDWGSDDDEEWNGEYVFLVLVCLSLRCCRGVIWFTGCETSLWLMIRSFAQGIEIRRWNMKAESSAVFLWKQMIFFIEAMWYCIRKILVDHVSLPSFLNWPFSWYDY